MVGLREIAKVLQAEVLSGEQHMNKFADMACGSDLMSDVLAFTKVRAILLTGLTNVQVVKTADISDLSALIFVRGKHPHQDVLLAAESKGIPVLCTKHTMFEACGRLYEIGLRGCSPKDMEDKNR